MSIEAQILRSSKPLPDLPVFVVTYLDDVHPDGWDCTAFKSEELAQQFIEANNFDFSCISYLTASHPLKLYADQVQDQG